MPQRVIIFDTSVLCCLLRVPTKDTCGPQEDQWNHKRVSEVIEEEEGSTFVLPLASIIETGNHISQAPGDRFTPATALARLINASAEAVTPWAAFTDQADLWSPPHLGRLAETWPNVAIGGTSIGDATIRDVAEYYARAGFDVEILTGDAGLKAYQPASTLRVPRRRR